MNNIALALGTFDGLHKGHQNVLLEAKKLDGKSFTPAALIFDTHPQKVLFGKAPLQILTPENRDEILKEAGILPFYVSFSIIKDFSPEEFVLYLKKMGIKAVCCGENFKFGKNSLGNTKILFELCQKYGIIFVKAQSEIYKGELVSSTRIRNALKNGNITDANLMLGRLFSYSFPVIHGKGKGNTWGFPTANQTIPESFIRLRFGVYATRVNINGTLFPAVTNFGVRPTAHENGEVTSETHIIGFNGDLYGEKLQLEFLDFIRDEQKFPSIDALSNQIKLDSKKAIEIYNRSK